MSTPLTDANEYDSKVWYPTLTGGPAYTFQKVVNASFARQLERELAEARAELKSNVPTIDGLNRQVFNQACEMRDLRAELKRKDEALAEIQMRTEVGADGTSDPFTQLHLIRRAAALAQGGKAGA